jgi:hypothetical protein
MGKLAMVRVRVIAAVMISALLGVISVLGGASPAQAERAGAQSTLVAVSGHGTGLVVISPTSSLGDVFDARVTVNIHNAAPDTSWTVTRAGDGQPDGVCHSIVVGTVAQFETSAGGAGAVEFERSGALSDFDLIVTVTGSDGTVLQSGCMIIHLK